MLTENLFDLQRITRLHEPDCNCRYCRRRRELYAKRVFFYLFMSIALVCLTVSFTFYAIFINEGIIAVDAFIAFAIVTTIFVIGLITLALAVRFK